MVPNKVKISNQNEAIETALKNPIGRESFEEFALIVSDEWQRKGLGSDFVDFTIDIAIDKGLAKLTGVVLKDNIPMITLCKEKNFKIESGGPGECKIEYDITKK